MKKFLLIVFSFMILLCGGSMLSLGLLSSSAEEGESNIKTISSAEEYVTVMSDNSIYGDKDVIIRLDSDINLEEVDLSGITAINAQFMGTFDGNGYTISNIKIVSSSQYFGLIPQASGATIKDVRVNGKVEYIFTPTNVKELYVGVLVGYGINVKFLNCEFDNVVGEGSDAVTNDISLPVYSNINFGSLAGRIRGEDTYIKDCINYYYLNLQLIKDVSVNIGGLVGSIENGSLLNTLFMGNINITNNVSATNAFGQVYIGGIVGGVGGSKAFIRNSLFGGLITRVNSVLNLNYYAGGVLGGKLSTIKSANINFVYYTDANLKPSGDNSLERSEIVTRIERIDRDFMNNTSNFDPATTAWDFDKVWRLTNSGFHLQNFQLFDYIFNNILDNGRILDSANFINKEDSPVKRLNSKYDEDVLIEIDFKQENYGYYVLSGIVLNGNYLPATEYTTEEKEVNGAISGYKILLKANAVTAGTYSFSISPKGYSCIATIADEANIRDEDNNIIDHQGGILIDSGTTPSFDPVPLTFYRDSKARTIIAEGLDIYVFDHWDMFVKDQDGNFAQRVELETSQDSALTVAFGTAPFDKEFKLIAYFTKNAINVSFGQYQTEMVKSITFGGKLYQGEPLPISPSATQSLVVVVDSDYVIDTDAFERDVKALYGNTTAPSTVVLSSETDEEQGITTYRFSVNMRLITQFDNNELKLSFMISQAKSDGMSSLLWLYILLPIVVVGGGAIVAVIIIIKKRRNSDDDGIGSSAGSGKGKAKAKKESYKDLY